MAVPERVKEVLLELLLLVLVVVLLVEMAALALSLLSALLSHVGQRSEAAGTMQFELARMVGVAVSRYKVKSQVEAEATPRSESKRGLQARSSAAGRPSKRTQTPTMVADGVDV